MSFTTDELALALQVVRDSLSGSTVEERLSAICEPLSALVPNTSLSAIVLQRSLCGPAEQEFAFFRNGDPANVREYAEHYLPYDPHPRFLAERPGEFVPHSRLVPSSRFGRDAFTGDFLQRHRLRFVVASELPLPDGHFLSFAIHREASLGDFSERECEVLRLLGNDIARATYGAMVRERAKVSGPRAGWMLLDPSGGVVSRDPCAARLLARLEGELGVPSELLGADSRRLRRAAPREGDQIERRFVLSDGQGIRARLIMLESRVDSQVLCVLESEGDDEGASRRLPVAPTRSPLDDLSPRERQVADLALEGHGNRFIALRLGISPVTVGVHLSKIYRKTGVSNRTELAVLLARAEG